MTRASVEGLEPPPLRAGAQGAVLDREAPEPVAAQGQVAADQGAVEARNAVARNMFRAWYVPFYEYGVIHGDPHLGNYSVRPDQGLNLLDYGAIRVFPPKFVLGVIELYEALKHNDNERAAAAGLVPFPR